MQDMRDCYDSLLSAAAAIENCAYEFSESLQEFGTCLLEKIPLVDDEESGKVLLLLGKVQFELQKLVDSYRSHISQTITNPSESLLNELRTVEEMKRQCDEKRNVYEYMVTRHREKGRSKNGKGESFSTQQLQAAHEEYDEEATFFVFRLKSLKQGQTRSLLTQAARHHAAQLCFFKKALKSLEAVEPNVKMISEKQHIDYHFPELDDGTEFDNDDDDDDDDDEDVDSYGVHDDGELSFDYGQNDQEQDDVSESRNLMELDQGGITFPQVTTLETAMGNLDRSYRNSFSFRGDIRNSSQSAPLFFEKRLDSADKFMQKQPSFTRKLNSYVLPTPGDTKSSRSIGSVNPPPQTSKISLSANTRNLWHSSPLEKKKYETTLGEEEFSGPAVTKRQSVLRESNKNSTSSRLPPPLADGVTFPRYSAVGASDYKKTKRQAFSGPLISKRPWPSKPMLVEHPPLFSGPILRNPVPQPPSSSPKVSPSASPTFTSSPRINELHELPRPPASSTSSSSRPSGLIAHSGPLVSGGHVLSATNKSVMSKAASPLPQPPQSITRSFSIPSGTQRVMALPVSKPPKAADSSVIIEDIASPPLTPLSLPRGAN
ncbi:hypothetical protein SLEP1_g6514 [Rubroshorea leprosula]|uniref:BAR domain-containing protein n=1 Tax=Rubroshorea leprosula TaxID=152421 RepID=A0AAV5HVG7_9ROSI|nr:hypothetical protein SLEP1_g6514 [Rubroshorea leprosula]